jgi:hypothetical protein
MKEIKLTRGKVAIVDDDMFEILSKNKWCYRPGRHTGYAQRRNGKTTLQMHRFIMGISDPRIWVDHKDGNGLNNQRSNLRIATASQNNSHLTKKRKDNSSGFVGVSWNNQKKKWVAQLQISGKGKHLGYFDDPIEAAKAYDKKAVELFGEFHGQLNFN